MRNKIWQKLISPRVLASIIIVLMGVGFYAALQNLESVLNWLNDLLAILSPFIFAFAFAYLLNPLVKKIDKRLIKIIPKKDKLRNNLSIFLSYVFALAMLSLVVAMVIPQVILSITTLFNSLPTYIDNLVVLLESLEKQFTLPTGTLTSLVSEDSQLVTYITDFVAGFLPEILDYSVRFGSSLVTVIMAFIVSIYMLQGKDRLLRQARKLLYAVFSPKKAEEIRFVLTHSNKVFSGFIIGKAVDSLIIGMLCFIGMTILGLPYTPLISVVIGITNFIPFFGPFIGAIPSVLILLIVNPWDALWFGIFVLALQQFDGNILGPYILGDSTGLTAIYVLVAIVVGGDLFGVIGMVIGVPVFAVLYHITSLAVNKALKNKGINADLYPVIISKPEATDDNDQLGQTEWL